MIRPSCYQPERQLLGRFRTCQRKASFHGIQLCLKVVRGVKLRGYLVVKLLCLNLVYELYSFYHFPKLPEFSQPAPVVLRTNTQLEHHAQHCIATQASFRLLGAMANDRKRRFNRIGGSQRLLVCRW